MILVKSPPSSKIIFGFQSEEPSIVCLMHQSYSSSVSPFHAKTGIFLLAIAAAAWSWVEKILHEDHLTVAPKSIKVSINTAVCIVIWRQPTIFAPFRGLDLLNSFLKVIKPGISVSAISISFRPHSARPISATL